MIEATGAEKLNTKNFAKKIKLDAEKFIDLLLSDLSEKKLFGRNLLGNRLLICVTEFSSVFVFTPEKND